MEGKAGVSPTLDPPAFFRKVGDKNSFWVSDSDTNDYFPAPATLRLVTDHAYFWISDEVGYRPGDLEALAEAFENHFYATNRAFFGSEWTPGVDGDPHIYILYTSGLGRSIAGYFSATDSLNPAVNEYSHGHDMFVFKCRSGLEGREDTRSKFKKPGDSSSVFFVTLRVLRGRKNHFKAASAAS